MQVSVIQCHPEQGSSFLCNLCISFESHWSQRKTLEVMWKKSTIHFKACPHMQIRFKSVQFISVKIFNLNITEK